MPNNNISLSHTSSSFSSVYINMFMTVMLLRPGCGLSNSHDAVLDGAPVGPAEHGLAPGWVDYVSFLLNGPRSVP